MIGKSCLCVHLCGERRTSSNQKVKREGRETDPHESRSCYMKERSWRRSTRLGCSVLHSETERVLNFLRVFLSYVFIISFHIPPWVVSSSCLCHSSAEDRVMNQSTLFPPVRPSDLSLASQWFITRKEIGGKWKSRAFENTIFDYEGRKCIASEDRVFLNSWAGELFHKNNLCFFSWAKQSLEQQVFRTTNFITNSRKSRGHSAPLPSVRAKQKLFQNWLFCNHPKTGEVRGSVKQWVHSPVTLKQWRVRLLRASISSALFQEKDSPSANCWGCNSFSPSSSHQIPWTYLVVYQSEAIVMKFE